MSIVEGAEDDYEPGDFATYFVKGFNQRSGTGVLLSPSPFFPGYREAVTVGLLTRIFDPSNHLLTQNVMRSAVLRRLQLAEAKSYKKYGASLSTDFQARHVLLGAQFFTELYYPLGGIEGLRKTPSSTDLKAQIKQAKQRITNVVWIAKLFHAARHAQMFKAYCQPPSLLGALDVSEALLDRNTRRTLADGSRLQSRRSLETAWSSYRKSVPLVYAATHVTIGTTTIADNYLNGNLTTRIAPEVVDEWLSKARYFRHNILAHAADRSLYRETGIHLLKGRCQPIPDPALTDQESEAVRIRFSGQ